jgi:hypothetical protein
MSTTVSRPAPRLPRYRPAWPGRYCVGQAEPVESLRADDSLQRAGVRSDGGSCPIPVAVYVAFGGGEPIGARRAASIPAC